MKNIRTSIKDIFIKHIYLNNHFQQWDLMAKIFYELHGYIKLTTNTLFSSLFGYSNYKVEPITLKYPIFIGRYITIFLKGCRKKENLN